MFLAFIGFTLSLSDLLAAYAGKALFSDRFGQTLFVGIFVVWLPTVIVMNRTTRFASRKDLWKIALSGCPAWMRGALWTFCGFGALNFLYFLSHQKAQQLFIRFAGGHLMMFYGIAFCVMYSALNAPELLNARLCINGHSVSPGDAFCPRCGVSRDTVSRPF